MAQLAMTILLAALAAHPDDAGVTLLDGDTVAGRITRWDAEGVAVETADGTRQVARDQLLDIGWPQNGAAPPAEAPTMTVSLVDGTQIVVTAYHAADRKAQITTPYASGPLTISVERIKQVHFQPPTEAIAALWQRIAEQELAGDVLLVVGREGDKVDYLSGVLGNVTQDDVTFDWDGQRVPIKRSRIAALAYYHAQPPRLAEAACELTLNDGSHVVARSVDLDDRGVLKIATPAGARLHVPIDAVSRADYSAGKLTYLSDLEPTEVDWTPRIALPPAADLIKHYGRPRRNASFAGSPLTLAWTDESLPTGREIRTYAKGLAIRSRTELTYRLPEDMRRFTATAGIDPATAGEGHVVLEIRADDRILWEAEIDGKRAPVDIDVELGAARRLHFRVDYGRNLDYGDRLHLVEARVTK
jgi:hypothetical protein